MIFKGDENLEGLEYFENDESNFLFSKNIFVFFSRIFLGVISKKNYCGLSRIWRKELDFNFPFLSRKIRFFISTESNRIK